MRTAHLVAGVVLIGLAVPLGGASFSLTGATCSDDPEILRLFPGLRTCGEVVSWMYALGGVGLLFLTGGIVVLATGKEKPKPEVVQVRGPEKGS